MKRFLASLLALLLLLPILACPATAETITIDTETATYEEIVAAYELLKAARIAHLKATFAENHEVISLNSSLRSIRSLVQGQLLHRRTARCILHLCK